MRGIGDILSAPLALPKLPAVLVNPRVAVPTKDVFAALRAHLERAQERGQWHGLRAPQRCSVKALIDALAAERNDLEAPAIAIAPAIAEVLADLRALKGCRLARMSGSGATCFGLFGTAPAAAAAAARCAQHPDWWVARRSWVGRAASPFVDSPLVGRLKAGTQTKTIRIPR